MQIRLILTDLSQFVVLDLFTITELYLVNIIMDMSVLYVTVDVFRQYILCGLYSYFCFLSLHFCEINAN